jgi:hypothetical protein
LGQVTVLTCFLKVTASGQKRLSKEADNWRRLAAVMGRLFAAEGK